MTLPSYERDATSPPLPAAGSAVALRADGDGLMSQILVHVGYRVTAEDRAHLGPFPVRHQLWLVAIHRETQAAYWSAPGRDAVVFAEEEPARGPIEGWVHAPLAAAAGIPAGEPGPYDVTAVLGPLRSTPAAVRLRAG